jgi:membrane dipeptidase
VIDFAPSLSILVTVKHQEETYLVTDPIVVDERATALHRDSLVLDATAPSVFPRPHRLQQALAELRAGGVDAINVTVASIEGARPAIEALSQWLEVLRTGAFPLRLATRAADVRAAKADGRVAVFFHFQGINPIEADLNLLNTYHALGVRIMQLTYNARNLAGDGCTETHDGGLSDFGRRAIARMNDLRIVIDLSHCGVRTSFDAIAASRRPVVVTHANAYALQPSPRNLSDDLIRAVAGQGGVIGACGFPTFLTGDANPTIEHFLNHIDYLCKVAGPEHVGLGLDYSQEDEEDYEYYGYDPRYYPRPPWVWPAGIRGFADMPNITAGLLRRGYSAEHVQGILGGNFLRVFEETWSA